MALEEIQDRHADEPRAAPGSQEAEITGNLEHPGIVPVYGLGHDATGRPFYAMRFIQGTASRRPSPLPRRRVVQEGPGRAGRRLRELLRRSTDVCNAIA